MGLPKLLKKAKIYRKNTVKNYRKNTESWVKGAGHRRSRVRLVCCVSDLPAGRHRHTVQLSTVRPDIAPMDKKILPGWFCVQLRTTNLYCTKANEFAIP
ncbi:hypothetical protein COOONC_06880 [Cooperia oncophora]